MKTYRHIFFDLDRTLWDFERNSRETLEWLWTKNALLEKGVSLNLFLDTYIAHNDRMWDQYSRMELTKEELRLDRFRRTLIDLGVDDETLVTLLAEVYIETCPRKPHLLPHALELLSYLDKKYQLHVITNGFEEVQHIKLESGGIKKYFKEIITSERTGARKPSRLIFEKAVSLASSTCEECLMVGDHFEADILGAREAGIDQVFLNRDNIKVNTLPTYTITCLSELYKIL